MSAFYDAVYRAVERIPRGKVATYGQIALLSGRPRASRAVGWALHQNPLPGIIPCHRVVGTNGSLTGYAGGVDKKERLLTLEGVDMRDLFRPAKGTAL